MSSKVDRADFMRVADQLAVKANREDVDQLFESLQLAKNDQEKRIMSLEKDFD